MAPGTTQFAVILWAARSCARAREKPTSADFAVMTWARPFEPIWALMPPILMMVPPFFFIAGRQACTQRKRAIEDDAHHLAPFREAHLVDRLLAAQRGVVDQDIDAAELLERGFGERGRGFFIGDVAEHAGRLAARRFDFTHDTIGFRLVRAHVHHDGRTGLRKRQRDRAADIAPGAGDDRRLCPPSSLLSAIGLVHPRNEARSILPSYNFASSASADVARLSSQPP